MPFQSFYSFGKCSSYLRKRPEVWWSLNVWAWVSWLHPSFPSHRRQGTMCYYLFLRCVLTEMLRILSRPEKCCESCNGTQSLSIQGTLNCSHLNQSENICIRVLIFIDFFEVQWIVFVIIPQSSKKACIHKYQIMSLSTSALIFYRLKNLYSLWEPKEVLPTSVSTKFWPVFPNLIRIWECNAYSK